MKEMDPATAAASQGYPDKAVLNGTLDQLKSRASLQIRVEHARGLGYASLQATKSMKKTTP
jgi:hypothetical protein